MRNNQRRTGQIGSKPSSPAPSQANLGYMVPTEFVELPSRGLFYQEDHPFYGQETVEIKFMTAREEDILASLPLIKKGLVIDRLLENIIVADVDPKTLLVGDRNALMIAARVSSYGKDYKVGVTCPTCGAVDEFSYNLKEATIIGSCFDEDYLNKNNIIFNDDQRVFEVELPKSKMKVSIKPVDGYTQKDTGTEDEDGAVTSLLRKFVVAVDGDPNLVAEFVDVMPAADSRFLRNLYLDLSPNVELKDTFVCSKCSYIQQDMEVPLTAEFFWPR